MVNMKNISKGEIILITSGEYSDYNVYGLLIALEDINTEELRNAYINKFPEQTDKYGFKEEIFLQYLKHLNLVKEIHFKEWYLASYSNISEMQVSEGPILFT